MDSMSFSVLIPDGESHFALFAVHGFVDIPQVKLWVLSSQRWTPVRFSRYCHNFIYAQGAHDPGQRLDLATEIVSRYSIDVVLPIETGWVALQDAKRKQLSELVRIVPVPNAATFESANNKWHLFKVLQANDIPSPPTVLCTLDGDFDKDVGKLKFPVLIKPVVASGGEGIQRFDRRSQLYAFLEQCNQEGIQNRYIVQSLLSGYTIDLNILCQRGKILAHTAQRRYIPNTEQYAAAGAIRFIKSDEALTIGEKLVSALSYNGVANLDLFYDTDDGRVKVLEVNPWFWATLRGSHGTGVSFPYLACLAALGIPFPVPDYKRTRYVHSKTAIRERFGRVMGRSEQQTPLEETGLKYLLLDPIAETLRALAQELS